MYNALETRDEHIGVVLAYTVNAGRFAMCIRNTPDIYTSLRDFFVLIRFTMSHIVP